MSSSVHFGFAFRFEVFFCFSDKVFSSLVELTFSIVHKRMVLWSDVHKLCSTCGSPLFVSAIVETVVPGLCALGKFGVLHMPFVLPYREMAEKNWLNSLSQSLLMELLRQEFIGRGCICTSSKTYSLLEASENMAWFVHGHNYRHLFSSLRPWPGQFLHLRSVIILDQNCLEGWSEVIKTLFVDKLVDFF